MDNLLEVDFLKKEYSLGNFISRSKLIAVDNISFFIKPAEIFTLAGESGCGKTTSAKIILGFEEQTSGTVVHKGKPKTRKEKVWITEGVQAIFQDPFSTFNPLRTVDCYFFETVHNFRLAKTHSDAIAIIDLKLKLVGLSYEEFAGKDFAAEQTVANDDSIRAEIFFPENDKQNGPLHQLSIDLDPAWTYRAVLFVGADHGAELDQCGDDRAIDDQQHAGYAGLSAFRSGREIRGLRFCF